MRVPVLISSVESRVVFRGARAGVALGVAIAVGAAAGAMARAEGTNSSFCIQFFLTEVVGIRSHH